MTDHIRVVISNVFGDENRGGTAITSVAISMFESRCPGASISLIPIVSAGATTAHTHRHTARHHPSVEILEPVIRDRKGRLRRLFMVVESLALLARPPHRTRAEIRRIADAGVVVGKGGQVFKMRNSAGSLLGFWSDVYPLLLARRLHVPAAVFSVTIGPYAARSPAARLASFVLRRLQLVVVRDERSAIAARELGVDPKRIRLAPDSVFAVRPPTLEELGSVGSLVHEPAGRFACVTVLPWKEFDDVTDVVLDALRAALDGGHIDEVLVVVQTTEDRSPSERLIDRAADSRFRLIADDLSPWQLAALYHDARFVVAGRMHSAILALVAGTPAHPIRPRGLDKASEMLDAVGLADFVCVVDASHRPLEASSEELRVLVGRDCDEADAVRARVRAAVDRARVQVEAVADELVALAGSRPRRVGGSPVDDAVRETPRYTAERHTQPAAPLPP
jgi:polysaccharide pyruvyl transferase WcaK-like protein